MKKQPSKTPHFLSAKFNPTFKLMGDVVQILNWRHGVKGYDAEDYMRVLLAKAKSPEDIFLAGVMMGIWDCVNTGSIKPPTKPEGTLFPEFRFDIRLNITKPII